MDFHPFSEIFPLLPDAELAELTADIKSFGLREPIWLYERKILDGRNRWLACQRAHVEPQYRTYKGTDAGALALVVSANLKRRQLTFEQRSVAAAKIATLRQGKQTGTGAGLTQAEAAEKFDVSERSVRSARQVIEKGSKPLQQAVERGEIPLTRAAAVVDKPKREQLKAAKEKPRRVERSKEEQAGDLGEFVTAADVELEEQEYAERIARVIDSDDRLKQMAAELDRASKEIAALKQARDRYMNECAAMRRQLAAKDREISRLKKASK